MKLLTKYALLTDCQRRARQLSDALMTATTQVLITLRLNCDADLIRQQVKQWTTVKHELVKSLQEVEKQDERSRFVTLGRLHVQHSVIMLAGRNYELLLLRTVIS